jgi:catecholate siderophore receptor
MSPYIRSRKHPAESCSRLAAPAAAALAAGLSFPIAAGAQGAGGPAAGGQAGAELPPVKVEAPVEVPYRAETSASPKATQPLLDTPRTIQVLPEQLLREQGAATLSDALRNTPGITMQLGENGNTSSGDTFQLRGFAAQSVIFVDGIRDLGAVTRDVFNVESIEVVKGPAGADAGRAAAAGYIGLNSKLPGLGAFSNASLGVGTDNRLRATGDLSIQMNERSAARLNLMVQDSDVPGRDFVNASGFGIAPSLAFGLGTATRFFLYSQHLRQDNVPDGGIPTIGMPGFYNANPALDAGAKVRRENYYGSPNDHEKVDADMVTARIEHDFGPNTRLYNLTRYGTSSMDRVLTGTGALAAPGADPATWTVARSRQRVDQTNEILANQTTLKTQAETWGLTHDLAVGMELLHERQRSLGTGTAAQTIRGVAFPAVAAPAANLYAPNPLDALGTPYLTGADTDGETTTVAAFVFDTLTIDDAWKVSAGLRLDRYRTSTTTGTIVTAANLPANPGYAVGGIAPAYLENEDTLLSWNAGVVYKPAVNGSVYGAVGTAQTPPGGGNFLLSATPGNQANAALDPQQTTSFELGTKWEVLERRLTLAGALFHVENDKQVTQDPFTLEVVQNGRTRVKGIELSAVGQLTTVWQIAAGIVRTDTRQLDQISVNAATGVVTGTSGTRWAPDLTASLWSTYRIGDFTFGGGARYVSDQKRVITEGTDLSTQAMPVIPAYWVADLMASYRLTRSVNLQLNLFNLFDKEYIGTLNNAGSRMVLGLPRSALLTASVAF